MKSKIKFFSLIIFSFLFFLFLSFSSKAFFEAEITSFSLLPEKSVYQAGEKIEGKFSIQTASPVNGAWVSLDISKIEGEKIVPLFIDIPVLPEMIFLKPNQTYQFSFSYQIPKNILSGDYQFQLHLRPQNFSFIRLGESPVIKKRIEGNERFLWIKDTWVIKDGEKFEVFEGASFPSNQNPVIEFKAMNLAEEEIVAYPLITIHAHGPLGKIVQKVKEKEERFSPGELKTLQYLLPKNLAPGGYTAFLQFFEDKNYQNPLSGSFPFHWLISSPSGFIESLSPLEEKPQANQPFPIEISLIKSIDDDYPLGEAKLKVELFDGNHNLIASKEIEISTSTPDSFTFDLIPQKTVENFIISASLYKNNELISDYSYKSFPPSIKPKAKKPSPAKEKPPSKKIPKNLIYFLSLALILLVALVLLRKKIKT